MYGINMVTNMADYSEHKTLVDLICIDNDNDNDNTVL